MSSDTFNPQTHASRVFYYTLTTVILLAGVTFLAWGERNEANFSAARAAAFWSLANAKDMAEVQAKFEYRKAYGGAVKVSPSAASSASPGGSSAPAATSSPAAESSSSPGAASSSSPAAATPGAASSSPAGAASPTASPGANPTSAQLNDQHALAVIERDRNDARMLAEKFEKEAQQEQREVERFAVAQVVLMIAVCLSALAGPTRQTSWCLAAMGLSLVAIALVAASYVL